MASSGSTDRTERRLHQQPFCQSTEIRNQLSYRTFLGILLASCFRSDHCFSVSEIRSGRWRNQSGFINDPFSGWCAFSFCSADFRFYDPDSLCRWICRSWRCCNSARRKHRQSAWKLVSPRWRRPSCHGHVRYECCFLRSFRNTDGSGSLFYGGRERWHYVLCRTGSMCDCIHYCLKVCGGLWHQSGIFSCSQYPGTYHRNRTQDGSCCHCLCCHQYYFLYGTSGCQQTLCEIFRKSIYPYRRSQCHHYCDHTLFAYLWLYGCRK